MIVALLIGRKASKGFPGKNLHKVLGKPLAYYPIKAAKECPEIDKIYLSSDDGRLIRLASRYRIEIIRRPPRLCTDKALGEQVYVHAYNVVKKQIGKQNIELLVLLMCNAPIVTSKILSKGIQVLRKNQQYDSAVTVSSYNMWSPLRARKIGKDGLLHPFIQFNYLGDSKNFSCDRDSQGNVWFADMGASIVRARCLEHIDEGVLPQRWMGKKIFPLKQWGGLDVDFSWQIPQVGYWLKRHLRRKRNCEKYKNE